MGFLGEYYGEKTKPDLFFWCSLCYAIIFLAIGILRMGKKKKRKKKKEGRAFFLLKTDPSMMGIEYMIVLVL